MQDLRNPKAAPAPGPADAGAGAPADTSAAQDIDWRDFRDHLATADKEGHRKWIYPRRPSGRWYQWRTWFSWMLLVVMFGGPFVRIQGNPLLMMNIVERRFSILGRVFWPEDGVIFAVAMLVFFAGIMIFTTAFGRLWCGWTCPQTVMMEMVFRKIEYAIEGDGADQRALDAAPWTGSKLAKKALKHAVFLGLSFVVGNTLLSYIVGSDRLIEIITDDPANHTTGLAFMVGFTLLFYAIFARFREQACTFICPYGRFQSALLDENTMVVAYDHRRGERRAPWRRDQQPAARREEGIGDCVNCHACVAVCPTGIDIRNGTQMECVNCAACIDACDAVMDKIGLRRGLVRYASLNGIERGEPLRFTPRMRLYAVVLAGLISLFLFLVFTRAEVQTILLRAPGALFQTAADGRISNLYTVKVLNKSNRRLPIQFRLENTDGTLVTMGGAELFAEKAGLAQTSLIVTMDPRKLSGVSTRIRIGVYSGEKRLETVRTSFVGPRTGGR